METAFDSYEDIGSIYIRLVRQESQEAAAAVERIQADFGSHAALRAALIITIFNEEVKRHHSIPDIRMYTYLLKDYREAIPLLEEAITRCLESAGMPQIDKSGWNKWKRLLEDHHNVARNPFDDLVQQVRQNSPITAGKLEQLYETYGITAGDLGATALIWLQARVDMFGSQILIDLTDEKIREFTYFEYMGRNLEALDCFTEMLHCYLMEHRPESIFLSRVISILSV